MTLSLKADTTEKASFSLIFIIKADRIILLASICCVLLIKKVFIEIVQKIACEQAHSQALER